MLKLDWNLVFTIINLIVLYLLLKKFLIGPITKIMEERRTQIENDLNQASLAKQEAEALKVKYEDALKDAKSDADQILMKAKTDADLEYNRIVDNAQTEAKSRIQAADKVILQDRDRALGQLKGEISGLTMQATDKILGRASGAENDRELYAQFLRESGEDND